MFNPAARVFFQDFTRFIADKGLHVAMWVTARQTLNDNQFGHCSKPYLLSDYTEKKGKAGGFVVLAHFSINSEGRGMLNNIFKSGHEIQNKVCF